MNHEQRLIDQAKEGDRSAFEALILRYDRDILRWLLRLLGDRESAKDAYQETFLRVFHTIGQFNQQSSFCTWIFQMATNICIDRLRKTKNPWQEVWIDSDRSKRRTTLTEALRAVTCQDNPERPLHALSRECISRALNALSATERLVFELKHYQGLKLRQIGEVIEGDEKTTRDFLYRAIRKLQAELTSDPDCASGFTGHTTDSGLKETESPQQS